MAADTMNGKSVRGAGGRPTANKAERKLPFAAICNSYGKIFFCPSKQLLKTRAKRPNTRYFRGAVANAIGPRAFQNVSPDINRMPLLFGFRIFHRWLSGFDFQLEAPSAFNEFLLFAHCFNEFSRNSDSARRHGLINAIDELNRISFKRELALESREV